MGTQCQQQGHPCPLLYHLFMTRTQNGTETHSSDLTIKTHTTQTYSSLTHAQTHLHRPIKQTLHSLTHTMEIQILSPDSIQQDPNTFTPQRPAPRARLHVYSCAQGWDTQHGDTLTPGCILHLLCVTGKGKMAPQVGRPASAHLLTACRSRPNCPAWHSELRLTNHPFPFHSPRSQAIPCSTPVSQDLIKLPNRGFEPREL